MNNKNEFVHLHLHTEYSLLDGMCRVGPLVQSVVERDMDAVAMTDHMSFFGVVPFLKEARSRGVKPIIGCEVDFAGVGAGGRETQAKGSGAQSFHLLLLAENNEGYSNLLKLVSRALTRDDSPVGVVDAESIQASNKGIIALSCCPRSEIGLVFSKKGSRPAARLVSAYKEIFGKDNFFLEISRHGVEGQDELNQFLVSQSESQDVPLVATNDVHYLDSADAPVHDLLLAIKGTTHLEDPGRTRLGSSQFYLKSGEEMAALFSDLPSALSVSRELAERCTVNITLGAAHLPGFGISPGQTVRSYLKMKCEQGLMERYEPERQAEARERLEGELEVVADKGLSGYFLVVWDLVRFARSRKIPVGPGRGSSVGSIISYCLGITDVDPLKYNLVFERFLTRERHGLPDIDVDLCHKCRDQVIEYAVTKYGEERVAHIATLDTLGPRSAVRDAGRALGLEDEVVDRVAKSIPGSFTENIEEALRESEPLARTYETDERAKRLVDSARAIQGLPRHPSIHAGGILITDAPLTDYVALQRLQSGEVIAQITKDPIEDLGLLKIDLLGLRFLTALYEAVELVKQQRRVGLEVSAIPLDDAATYELLSSGNTHGVFQLESAGMQDLLRKLKPDRFEDIVVVISLFRPGPIGGGLVDRYIARRHGREEVEYPHPILEPVLRETYGVILYQEQVMEVSKVMADFSMEEADGLRASITGRKPGELASMRQRFLSGAVEKGVEGETADKVFNLLLHFGRFGYNKSHSVAFALTTYRCAYMMANFTTEYVAALLNNNLGFIERMRNYMAVAREKDVEFLPCNANISEAEFTIEEGAIRAGLAIVKHVGEVTARDIVAERKANGDFGSLTDFCFRMRDRINRQGFESLIKAGALDFTGLRRSQMTAVLGQVLKAASDEAAAIRETDSGQFEMGLKVKVRAEECVEIPEMEEWPQEQMRAREWEVTDLFVTEHPLHERGELLRQMGILTVEKALGIAEGEQVSVAGIMSEFRRIRAKSGRPMAFMTLRDETGVIEVVIFPNVFERLAQRDQSKAKPLSISLTRDEPLVVTGKIQAGENAKLICETLEPLESVEERFYAKGVLEIRLPEGFKKFSRLKNTLLSAPGNSEVKVELPRAVPPSADGVRAEVASLVRHKVQLSEALLTDVERIVGKGNVTIYDPGRR